MFGGAFQSGMECIFQRLFGRVFGQLFRGVVVRVIIRGVRSFDAKRPIKEHIRGPFGSFESSADSEIFVLIWA